MQACVAWPCSLQGLTCVGIFQLCFASLCFVIIADHYYSLIVIAAGFAFVVPSLITWIR